jgi:hypothetical protein
MMVLPIRDDPAGFGIIGGEIRIGRVAAKSAFPRFECDGFSGGSCSLVEPPDFAGASVSCSLFLVARGGGLSVTGLHSTK